MPQELQRSMKILPERQLGRHSGESRNPGYYTGISWMPDQVRHDEEQTILEVIQDY
jgi:hypothetical protein